MSGAAWGLDRCRVGMFDSRAMARRFLFRNEHVRRASDAPASPRTGRRQGEVLRVRGGAAAVVRFDARFGAGLLATVPTAPGTYIFRNAEGEALYVGKARNLRARLRQYRQASGGRRGLRMRGIVAEAAGLAWEVAETELAAELRELALIQQLRPPLNIVGAHAAGYPFWGVRIGADGVVAFCHVAAAETAKGFALHGAWRSRGRSLAAFSALMRLLALLGHPEPARRARASAPELRGRIVAFRQLSVALAAGAGAFLRGDGDAWLGDLCLALLERASARRRPEEVQADLALLRRFWRDEVAVLRQACEATGFSAWPVPQEARDPLLLRVRASNRAADGEVERGARTRAARSRRARARRPHGQGPLRARRRSR